MFYHGEYMIGNAYFNLGEKLDFEKIGKMKGKIILQNSLPLTSNE